MIVSVAVKIGDLILSLPRPARHHNVVHMFNRLFKESSRPHWSYEEEVQGFLDDKGNFLTRLEAMTHVKECGQKLVARPPNGYKGQELYSEDLW